MQLVSLVLVQRVQRSRFDHMSLAGGEILENRFALKAVHGFEMIPIPPGSMQTRFEYRIGQRHTHSVLGVQQAVTRPRLRLDLALRPPYVISCSDNHRNLIHNPGARTSRSRYRGPALAISSSPHDTGAAASD